MESRARRSGEASTSESAAVDTLTRTHDRNLPRYSPPIVGSNPIIRALSVNGRFIGQTPSKFIVAHAQDTLMNEYLLVGQEVKSLSRRFI